MASARLSWRYSRDTGYHYLEDSTTGWATVMRSDVGVAKPWYSNVADGYFTTCRAAKLASERAVRRARRLKPRSRRHG